MRAIVIAVLLLVGCGQDDDSPELASAPQECPATVATAITGATAYCVACDINVSTGPASCNSCTGMACYKHNADGLYYIQLPTALHGQGECLIAGSGLHVAAGGACP